MPGTTSEIREKYPTAANHDLIDKIFINMQCAFVLRRQLAENNHHGVGVISEGLGILEVMTTGKQCN